MSIGSTHLERRRYDLEATDLGSWIRAGLSTDIGDEAIDDSGESALKELLRFAEVKSWTAFIRRFKNVVVYEKDAVIHVVESERTRRAFMFREDRLLPGDATDHTIGAAIRLALERSG